MKKHGTFSQKQNILNRKLRANPGCRTELPRDSCPSGGNCPEAHFPSRNILDGSCSAVNCPENNCPRCELPRRHLSREAHYLGGNCPWRAIIQEGIVLSPFLRIEAGDCILLLTNFLFKLFKTSYIKDSEAVARRCSVRKSVPRNFVKKDSGTGVFL